MIKNKTLVAGFILFTNLAVAQKIIFNFEVYLDGKMVGTMIATKDIDGQWATFNLHSDVETKIFKMSLEVESELEMVTKDSILIEGKSFQYSNRGTDHISASVQKLPDNTYLATKNTKNKIFKVEKIINTVTDLYFNEPKGVTTLFSVADADFLHIRALGNGRYALVLPNKKKNTFSYVNGFLDEVKATILVGAIKIKRIYNTN